MDKKVIIINGIFYLILTVFFIYIFVKEKELVEKINLYKEEFSKYLIRKLNIKKETTKKVLTKFIYYTETISTALILVLVIQRFYLGNFMVPTGSMIPTIMPGNRLFGNMLIYKFSKPKREDIAVFKEPIQNKVLYTKRVMGLPGDKIKIQDEHLFINNVKITERKYLDLGEIKNKEWTVPQKGDKVSIVPFGEYNEMFKRNNIDIAEVQKYILDNPGSISEILPQLKFYVNGQETGMLLELVDKKEVVTKIFAGEKVEITLTSDYYMMLGDNTDSSYDSRMWGFVSENRIRGKAFVRFWPLNKMSLLK
ncbi:MAG: signal peptidase I [Fusobacteriaceae bacterium]